MKIHIKSVMYITIDNFMSVQIATMLHKFVTRDFMKLVYGVMHTSNNMLELYFLL